MNKIFRVIWNASKGVWQAVGEIGSSKSKSRCRGIGSISLAAVPVILGSSLLISPLVLAGALPSGGQVNAGSAEISVSGNKLQVVQSSQKAVIDWQSFSIGQGNEVEFSQPSAQAAALNRVTGSQVSDIRGSLKANGQVFLINPNGILFSATSEVNVGALVSSTLDISNEDFISGNYNFEGAGAGIVINRGNIHAAEGGFVAMIAASVINTGSIDAYNGTVAMAAGKRIVLDMGGPVKIAVEEGAIDAYVEQGGAVRVDSGLVMLTAKTAGELTASVINHTGITEAQTLQTDANGRIVLAGDGDVNIAGTLDVSSAEGKGGQIQITGAQVALQDGALLDASGRDGGGQVLVGGDYQGKNVEVPNAIRTYVDEGARILADATGKGDGGKVIVWADEQTDYAGHISAQGGALGGDGGFAEVSGKQTLDFKGTVDLTALEGKTGTLLLDPTNLTITESDNNVSSSSPYSPTGAASTLSVSTLTTALDSANVIVTTNSSPDTGTEEGDIMVASSIGWFSNNTLTLDAAGAININDAVNIQTFDGSLTLTAVGAITQTHTTGGKLLIGGTTTITSGADITLTSTANQLMGTVIATANAGSLSITNARALVLGDTSASGPVALATVDNAGSITATGTFVAGALSAAAHDTGGISIADVNGGLTVSLLEAGGAITLGNTDSGALTFTHSVDGSNVIVGNDAAGGQASGIVTITGASLTLNDAIRTKGGTVNLISETGAITAAADADIVTTADVDTGTASGLVNVTAANGMMLQKITTTGADNAIGVGSNAAAVTLTASAGDIHVGAITTTGGDATAGATSNRNGGNAGNILLAATAGTDIHLDGDLTAIGGGFVGAATQGLGGYIKIETPTILTANRLISSGVTSGNIDLLGSLDSVAGASYSLNVVAGVSDVMFDGVIGGSKALTSMTASGVNINIEKNVTTDGAAGLNIDATQEIRLGDDDLTNDLGTITINTLAGNGSVDLNSGIGDISGGNYSIYLDDAVTFTRGTGTININDDFYSNTNERNDLTFDGAGGGAVVFAESVGGSSASANTKLGNILFDSVTDITMEGISAESLISLNGTGSINTSGGNGGAYYLDGAGGLQLSTTGADTAGDENITFYPSVYLTEASAPIWMASPNGSITLGSSANLVTAGGGVTLKAGSGALTLGSSTDITTSNGLLSLTGTGISQSATNSVLNAGSGKIRIDAGGSAVTLYGRLITTDADSNGTPSILVNNATGANFRSVETQTGTFQVGLIAGDANLAAAQSLLGTGRLALTTAEIRLRTAQAITITSGGDDSGTGANVTFTVTGTNAAGNPLVEAITGGTAAAVTTTGLFKTITSITSDKATAGVVSVGLAADDTVAGSLTQYIHNSYSDNQIDIKTLSAATTGQISVTSTANIIDQLGGFSVGSSLDVRASGRTTGMVLTGDVTATNVTIKTGVGVLALGDRDITATSGNMLLQGRGVTQGAGSTVSTTGTVTVYGSDYASQGTRGDVVMAGNIVADSTASTAVTIADTNAITIGSITTGSVGSRGGLRLGTHDHNGSTYRRAYGVIGQTAGSQLTIGALDIRQLSGSGSIDLSLLTNEIQSVGYVERGGAISLFDKDTEANGLILNGSITAGTNSNAVKIETLGALNHSHHIYGQGITLAGASITSSNQLFANYGSQGNLVLQASGGDITLNSHVRVDGAGNDLIIRNAGDVQLSNTQYLDGELQIGSLGVSGALAASQTVLDAADLTLDGTATSLGSATFDVSERVAITSDGDDSGIAFTVTGTDMFGRAQTEVITGASAAIATGSKYFASITQIAASGAAANNVSVGTALENITGNVTQTSSLNVDAASRLSGVVVGNITLENNENYFTYIDDLTVGGDISLSSRSKTNTLHVAGDVASVTGNISIRNNYFGLQVDSTGSVTGQAAGSRVTLTATDNYDINHNANIQGAIVAGTGGIVLSSDYGNVYTSGLGTLTSSTGSVSINSGSLDAISIGAAVQSATGVFIDAGGTFVNSETITSNGEVIISSGGSYTGSTNYSTSIQNAISAGVGGTGNLTINSRGTFTNNTAGALTATGKIALKTYWDGTYERNMTLGGNIAAGANGIQLTSSGTINQTGGVLTTLGTLSGPSQSGGTASSSVPSARGAVTLTANNEIANLGPFYLYDEAQVAFALNDVSGGLTLSGNIENSHGAINISTTGGALDLSSYDVYAGGMATGGAAIALTGQGLSQGADSEINTTGGATGNARTGSNGGGTITLTGHDGSAAGSISLAGGVSTVNDSTSAITIRGTTDLQLPGIIAVKGSLVLGDETATIGLITGNITQSDSTALDIKTLQVGTATNAVGGSVVLANNTNKIETLAGLYSGAHQFTGPANDIPYDLDIYDSTGGLSLTGAVVSDQGIRVSTTDTTTGVLSIGANSVLASGDIYLGGLSVTQAAGSTIDADNSGAGGIGGSIRIDGGGSANNITLEGIVTTDNASATAIEIVNATNATLNTVNASAGALALGVDTKELTGTVSQLDVNSTISAATLVGDASVVTINKANIDNFGQFTTSGALTLKEQGGSGTAGLKYTGSVTTGGTTWIETTDGIQNLDTQTLDATGQAITLKGVALSQQTASSIKSTTADLYGGAGDIDLFSTTNDFTGQVTVHSTGAQVSLQDANQLSMNTLTDNLDVTTSIKLWSGAGLVLSPEDISTTSGNIELRSLDGNLSTPGDLTTTTGNVALYAATNVQVNNTLTTGSGNVTIDAGNEVNLSKTIVSTSGNINVKGDTITHSTGSVGTPLKLQTGSAGTITVAANGTGGFVMGQYYSYLSDAGTIAITSGGTADLANITTNGRLSVDAVGLVQQVGAGSILSADELGVTTANNGVITLANVDNDLNKVKLLSRNEGNNDVGSGTITFNDVDGFAVSKISTSDQAILTANGAITTDAVTFGDGAVVANTLTVKTLNAAGADITLTAAGNDVDSLSLNVRNADNSAIAGETTTPTGTIKFNDSNGFVVTAIETGGTTVLTAGDAVTQTGAISSAKLGLSGVGDYTLNLGGNGVPVNQISTFASDATGAVNLTTNLDLVIGSVNPEGITTKGADISITAPKITSTGVTINTSSDNAGTVGGAVLLTTSVSGGAGNLTVGDILTNGTDATIMNGGGGAAGAITLTSAGEILTVGGTITARGGGGAAAGVAGADGTVKLLATAGAVLQANGDTEINAGKVLLDALNSSALIDVDNTVDQVAAKISGIGENFTYRSGADYEVGGGQDGITGITTQGGFVDISSSDYAISVTQNISTKGGAFSATGVRSFNFTGLTISTAGDITYASGAYKNGGTIDIATTANNGNVNTGNLVSSGDVHASAAAAGNITLDANGVLTVHATNAQGKGSGTGGVVSLTGSAVNIAGSVVTSSTGAAGGIIDVNGPAVLVGGDHVLATGLGAGDIDFSSTLNSDGTPRALSITAGTGDILFNGAVGVDSTLGALNIVSAKDVTMSDTLAAASLMQSVGTGTLTLDGAVTLSANLAFTGNNLSVNAATDVGGTSTISNAGLFSTAVAGDITSVGIFGQVGAGTNELAGDISTTNSNISFATGVVFTGDVAMDTNTGLGNIVFADILDSDTTPRDLTLSSGTGNVTFAGIVGGTNTFDVLNVNSAGVTTFSDAVTATSVTTDAAGTVELNGQTVNTTGTQTYNDALSLGDNTILTGTTITTKGSLTGTSHSLLVTGDAVFGDAADDGLTGLTTLKVTGTTTINTDTITSADAQTYSGAVILGNSTTLTAADDPILFSSTVDAEATEANGMTVNADSGDVIFTAAVGAAVNGALGALSVNSSGVTQFSAAVNADSVTTNAGGTTVLDGGTVTTAAAQTYGDAVTLGVDTTLSGTDLTLSKSVDGAYALALDGSGATTLSSAVGSNTALASLTTDAAGTTVLDGGTVTTSTAQTYGDDVTLGADTTLSGTDLTLSDSVDGAYALALDGSGATTLGGIVGGDTALTSLTTNAAGTTALDGGAVTTSAAQSYGDAVTLGANTTLSGTDLTLSDSVDGAYALALDGSGATTLSSAVGSNTALTSLTTDAAGTTALDGGAVTTTATQTYGDNVALGADTILTGTTLTTHGTVDGATHSLNVVGDAVLGDTAGDTVTRLTTLAISGTTGINTSTVTSSGTQDYTSAVTLGADTTLSGSDLTLSDSVDGAYALALDGSGATTLGGIVGGDTALTSLTTNAAGTTALDGGAVTTSAAQSYGDAVTLGADTTLSGTDLTLSDSVDGAYALALDGSGATTLSSAVGSNTALTSLTTDAAGTTALDGGAVTTTATQTYGDNVALGADTTLTGTTLTTHGTVDGATHSLNVVGDAVLGDAAGDTVTRLTTLAISGTTGINTSTVTSSGTQDYTGAVTIGADTTLTTTDSTVTFDATIDSLPSAAKSLTINAGNGDVNLMNVVGAGTNGALGSITLTGNNLILHDVTTTGEQTYNGAINTNSTYTSAGSNITFNGDVIMNDALVVTTGAGAGTITFVGTLDSEATEANTLDLTAGIGDIALQGAVGAAQELGAINVNSTANVTTSSTIAAASLTQLAGSGITTIGGAVTLSAVEGMSLTGTDLVLNAAVDTATAAIAGTVTTNHSGTATISAAGDINADGAVSITATGGISTAGDIATTGDDISLLSATTLTGDSALTTGGATGAINFASSIDGAYALRLLSGAAQSFNAVGGTAPLTLLRVESTGEVTQTAAMKVGSLAIKSAGATLSDAGNDIDTLAALMSGDAALVFVDVDGVEIGTIDASDLQIIGISDGAGTSNVSITVGGLLSQGASSPISIDGNLTVDTTAFAADDVSLKNASAGGTEFDNTLVAGDFSVNSTGDVTQKIDANGAGSDAWVQVGGSFNMTGTGAFVEGNSTDNLIGGGSATTAANELRLFGVITLSMNTAGDLVASATTTGGGETSNGTILVADLTNGAVVTSDAGGKNISAVTDGNAILLNESNTIGGTVKITTQGVYSNAGIPVATGILQTNKLNLAGDNSFQALQSTANSGSAITGAGAIDLSNAANSFAGTVSVTAAGMDIHLRDSNALDLGNVNGGNVTIEADVDGANAITQTGVITATTLLLQNAGAVTLNNNNRITTVAANVSSALSLANNQPLTVGTVGAVNGITAGGDITLASDALAINRVISATGYALTLKPLNSGTSIGLGDGVAGSLSINATEWSKLTDGFSSIIVGRNDGSGKITTGALTVNDNLTLINASGGIELTGLLNAGTNTMILDSMGVVTDTGIGRITATSLALQGIGATYTLDAASNDVDLLSANSGSVTYVDADALNLGTFNQISGITATGAVDISTLNEDLTVSQNVSGTAIRLNAGQSEAAGTATGGNVVLNDSPLLTASTGNAILYTGSIADSTGVSVSASSGNFRYNADEATNFSTGGWTDLGATGTYAVYREQPVISVAAVNKTVTYGDADPTSYTGSYTGLLNGDAASIVTGTETAVWGNAAGTTSTGGQRIVGDYDVVYNSGLKNGLGYGFTDNASSVNELTVDKLILLGSITAGGNTYGSMVAAGSLIFSNSITGDSVVGDTVTVNTSVLLSTSNNLKAGTHTGIQSVGAGLAGADAGNYSFASTTADYRVDQLALGGAIDSSSNVYGSDLVDGGVSYNNLVASDVLTAPTIAIDRADNTSLSGNLNAGSYTGIQSVSTLNGTDAANYSIGTFSGGDYEVSQLALTGVATAADKGYDGNTTASSTLALSGLIGSETLTTTVGSTFNDKDVANATTVTINSATLVDGTNGGLASNYSLFTGQTDSAVITTKALTGVATATDKGYDGNTTASSTLALSGLIGNETLTITAVDSTFNDKDVANATTVTINSATLVDGTNGGLVSNYSLVTGQTDAAVITTKALTGVATAADKGYDGNTTASSTLALSGLIGSETLTTTAVGSTFNDKDVADATTVTINSVTLVDGTNGGLASNYSLVTGQADAAVITTKALTGEATAADKGYDGNTTASSTLALSGLIGSETLITTVGSTFNDKDVADATTVTINSATLVDGTNGGLASNYSLVTGQTDSAVITTKALTGVATAADKGYDGNTTASSELALSGLIGSETLTITAVGSTFNDKDVADATTVTINSATLVDGTNGGLASNYSLVTGQTDAAVITTKALTGAAIAGDTSVYADALTPGAVSFSNIVNGDTVISSAAVDFTTLSTSSHAIVGNYAQTATSISGTESSNYSFAGFTTADNNYQITQRELTGAAIANDATVYGEALTAGAVGFSNIATGDAVTSSASVDTNALSTGGQAIVGDYTQTAGSIEGADKANYSFGGFTTGSNNYSITQLLLNGAIGSGSNVYGSDLVDGSVSYSNLVASDLLTAATIIIDTAGKTSPSGNLNAGSYTGIQRVSTLNGTDAGNYSIGTFSGGDYDVSQLALTGSITTGTTVYGDALVAGTASFTNKVGIDNLGDASVVVNTNGNTSSSGKFIAGIHTGAESVSALSGLDVDNYTFSTVKGDYIVNQVDLSVVGVIALDKIYDGTNTTKIDTSIASLNGAIANDIVSIGSMTGSFLDKNAGDNKEVNGSEVVLLGSDGGNYNLIQPTGLQASISQRALTVSISIADDKVYDSATDAIVTLTDDRVSGDQLSYVYVANFIDKNVGNNKFVSVSNISLTSSADLTNYTVNTTASGFAAITAKAIAIIDVQSITTGNVLLNTIVTDVVNTPTSSTRDVTSENINSSAVNRSGFGSNATGMMTGLMTGLMTVADAGISGLQAKDEEDNNGE